MGATIAPAGRADHRHETEISIGAVPGAARSFIIAVVLFLFVRAFFVEAFKIPSGSMERTLLVGDFLLVNKLVYGAEVPFTGKHLPALHSPERGDVVVFQWPEDPTKNFVKRLVGVPGDTLAMRDGMLIVNGVPQAERYVTHTDPGADPSGGARLAAKADAGASFAQTQPVYDVAQFAAWLDRLAARGLPDRVAILAGILPPASAAQLERFAALPGWSVPEPVLDRMRAARDQRAEGIALAAEMVEATRGLPGVRGVHLMGLGPASGIPEVIETAGLLPRPKPD